RRLRQRRARGRAAGNRWERSMSKAARSRTFQGSSVRPFSHRVDDQVSLPGWLRTAIAARRLEHEPDRAGQVDLRPDGDEDGLGAGLSAHHLADNLLAMSQIRGRALLAARVLVFTDQPGFGAADAWPIQPQTEVRGDTDA